MKLYCWLLAFLQCAATLSVCADAPELEQSEPGELIVYNRILAKVNSKTISVVDVMKKMDLFLQKHYPQFAHSKAARFQFYSAQWKNYLSQIIDQELMIADAEKLEIKVSDAEVREEILNRFGPNIMPTLDALGFSYEEARQAIHDELVVQKMLWFRVNSKALSSVNSLDVKEAYKNYCEKNPEVEEWQYQVLSIRSPNEEASKALAERAFDLLKSNLELSEVSAQLQGAEEEVVSIHLSPELQADEKSISESHKAVLKSLSENAFSTPIAQASRADHSVVYRIFYLKKHARHEIPPFEKIAEALREQLLQQAAERENTHYIAKLKARLGFDEKHLFETLPHDFQPFAIQ